MSPLPPTPKAEPKKPTENVKTSNRLVSVPKRKAEPEKKSNNRYEQLMRWKEEKDKLKKLQQKKPVFKVAHIERTIGLPKLDKVNFEIKGKSFTSKFAPPNHQFKAPANIKPIQFTNVQKEDKKTKAKKVSPKKTRMMTRSQARKATNEDKAPKAGKKEEKPNHSISSHVSTDYTIDSLSSDSESVKTPKKTEPPVYISPFVTCSRGKNSARKEHQKRKSGIFDLEVATPAAGAAYFTYLLDQEITRLGEFCDKWTTYKNEQNPPEEAVDMINTAIGQTNLLLTKKFVQFRGLIQQAEEVEARVTCEDLHGFWDMMHIQVEGLHKRFDNLDNLKANNWEEILPVVVKKTVKRAVKSKKGQASAGLKAAIQAARRKKQLVVENNIVKTPRQSLRISAAKSTEKRNSPGLFMFKATQSAKAVNTPAKSILKTDCSKSANKSVVFRDVMEDLENDVNRMNLEVKTPRRSARLSLAKLF